MIEKVCSKCHIPKELDKFYVLPSGKPRSWCKPCVIGDVDYRRAVKRMALRAKGLLGKQGRVPKDISEWTQK